MSLPLPTGFRANGVRCGLKKQPGALDLGLLIADEAAPAWALFTRNRLNGAHIPVCRDHLARSGGRVRAVLVNAGNANCATGPEGIEDARGLCAALAERIGCPTEQVLMISTGVIGARLRTDLVETALDDLLRGASPTGGEAFASAIMTTDTYPKTASAHARDGSEVRGFAKGSGMIHPDMATMLAFLLADAPPADGAAALTRVTDRSFHRTTVDGDTSPNDTVLLWCRDATRVADEAGLEAALTEVAQGLAREIARDGEGATRLVTVRVAGAADEQQATHIGRAVARSPLVKTAVTGRDPNWGRILSAAASAGIEIQPERARLSIGGAEVYREGRPRVEGEGDAHRHMVTSDEVEIVLDLGQGGASADVWTCDLTKEYVEVNASYRS